MRDSDATLMLVPAAGAASAGSDLAVEQARALGRPCLVIDPTALNAAEAAEEFSRRLPPESILNVAGPRESEAPGLHASALRLLEGLFRSDAQPRSR